MPTIRTSRPPQAFALLTFLGGLTLTATGWAAEAKPPAPRAFVINFSDSRGLETPKVGFLGGLRDDTPDAIVAALHPSLFRIGHQFRKRIAGGLPAAVDRVRSLGATYKLVISDLVHSQPKDGADWSTYEADVRKLVASVGSERARDILWEPQNEPDVEKPDGVARFYVLYAHAFKALREECADARICGPGFAFPSYQKYRDFLEYCREHGLECNALSWHYTGWDPHAPEAQKWQLGRLGELASEYPLQKIKAIHCDEWGAGPDKPSAEHPGRLEPGRAIVWFYYLEDVFHVDAACRANWGGADDYLGGIITANNETYPAWHAYRFYGQTAGMERVSVQGNDRSMAVLAHKAMTFPPIPGLPEAAGAAGALKGNATAAATASQPRSQILLGGVTEGTCEVTLELQNAKFEAAEVRAERIPADALTTPLATSAIPSFTDFKIERRGESLHITIPALAKNEVVRFYISRR